MNCRQGAVVLGEPFLEEQDALGKSRRNPEEVGPFWFAAELLDRAAIEATSPDLEHEAARPCVEGWQCFANFLDHDPKGVVQLFFDRLSSFQQRDAGWTGERRQRPCR